MDSTVIASVAIAAAAGSEIIGMMPVRENSWIQLLLKVLQIIGRKK
jgi:hypothetical protein